MTWCLKSNCGWKLTLMLTQARILEDSGSLSAAATANIGTHSVSGAMHRRQAPRWSALRSSSSAMAARSWIGGAGAGAGPHTSLDNGNYGRWTCTSNDASAIAYGHLDAHFNLNCALQLQCVRV